MKIGMFLLACFCATNLFGKACTETEAKLAMNEFATLSAQLKDETKFVDALKTSFKKYGHCDDGSIGEGYSDVIVRFLASGGKAFEKLAPAMKADAKFRAFVLQHLDESAQTQDLELVLKNAKTSCPASAKAECAAITTKTTAAIKGG